MAVVEVKLSDDLRRATLLPRRREDTPAVVRSLRTLGLTARRSAEGVTVPLSQAAALTGGVPGIDLRWSEDALRSARNRDGLDERHLRLRNEIHRLERLGRAELEGLLSPLDGIATLDDHQVINVAAMTHPGCHGLCLFDEQGAGKTVSVIFAFDLLAARDEIDSVLIFAPKSMIAEWARDLRRFRGDLYSVAVCTGSRREKIRSLRSGADVLITNFESAFGLERELTAHLRRLDGRVLLVVDESFFVKNKDARRTRALARLREWCGRAYVLCGTPAPNSARDVVEQVSLADFGATFGGLTVPEDRTAAHAVVSNALESRGVYLRSLKREVLPDLPRKTFHVVRLELAPEQRRAYDAALRDLVIDLRSTTDAEFARRLTSYMARRATLLQLCSHPGRIIPGYVETPAKLEVLDSLLEDLIETRGEKVVVWSAYRASLDALVARYERYGVSRYDGSVTEVAARREAVRAFQEDAATRLFVGNPAAAGAGLTLHAARFAIYESLTNQAAHFLQSVDRIHRRGQTREVEYVVLLGVDTIEEPSYDGLRLKESQAQDLLGDGADGTLTREAMLAELLSSSPITGPGS